MFIRSDTGDTHGVNEPRVIQSVDPQHRVLGIFLTADDNSDSIYEFNEVVGFHVEFFSYALTRTHRSSLRRRIKFFVAFPNIHNSNYTTTKISRVEISQFLSADLVLVLTNGVSRRISCYM